MSLEIPVCGIFASLYCFVKLVVFRTMFKALQECILIFFFKFPASSLFDANGINGGKLNTFWNDEPFKTDNNSDFVMPIDEMPDYSFGGSHLQKKRFSQQLIFSALNKILDTFLMESYLCRFASETTERFNRSGTFLLYSFCLIFNAYYACSCLGLS